MSETSENRKTDENPVKSAQKRIRPETRPWITHGIEDIYFQREAQVNFWTVLGGLAMAALLTQLSPLLREIQNTRFLGQPGPEVADFHRQHHHPALSNALPIHPVSPGHKPIRLAGCDRRDHLLCPVHPGLF